MQPFPKELFHLGPFVVTDTMLGAMLLSICLLGVLRFAMLNRSARESLELTYEVLERSIVETTNTDVRALVPLVLTLWLFIGAANLVGLLPGLASPTRDLSLAAALAVISFGAGHVYALRQRGLGYLKRYIEPSPFLLPFNVIGEVSRTLALALRLFGNMLSGALVSAIFLYLAGLLIPVPLMLLSALTAVVQAYIFGVLTLVFAASSLESAERQPILSKGETS
ncbi:MAG: F0F1 ATP synthase subunit A [Myxococcales bacterium]|nr:F0F1 ATP synthase subunit A [Myxococcales bacterium]